MATFLAILPKCCQNRLAEVSSAMLPPIEDLPLAWVSSRSGSVSGTGGWRTRVCGFGGVRFWFSSGTLVSFGVG